MHDPNEPNRDPATDPTSPNHTPPSPPLTSQQLKHLRGLAHGLDAMVQVGAAGVTDAVLGQVDTSLARHELIKVRLREPDDKKAMAHKLADKTGSSLCGLVGHTVILFRRNPDEPRIAVPGLPTPAPAAPID